MRRTRQLSGAGLAAALLLAGCGRMATALGQQWVVVQFNPNTPVATARNVIHACSALPGMKAEPVQPSGADTAVISTANINTTSASSADLARLQMCLQRFGSVQGITVQEAGAG